MRYVIMTFDDFHIIYDYSIFYHTNAGETSYDVTHVHNKIDKNLTEINNFSLS